jgi:glycosyltransferase involved in cell wall biosynthesis
VSFVSTTFSTSQPRIAWLGVEPTPYFLPLFNRLCGGDEVDLHFFFCHRGLSQPWSLDGADLLGQPLQSRLRAAIAKPASGPELVGRLFRERWDGAVICGYHRLMMKLGIAACILRGVPFLIQGDTQDLLPCSPLKRAARRIALRPILRRCRGALGVGGLSMQYWERLGVQKASVMLLPYASHLEYYVQRRADSQETRQETRNSLGISADRVVGLFVGRLVGVKGVDLLLDGLRLLPPSGRPTLLVVGDGPERANLERAAVEAKLPVKFLGFREAHELPPLFAAADFFLMPSRVEPWGIVLAEAMASGLAVVASDQVGAAYDLLEEGQNGFLVREGSAEAWSDALQRCFSERDRLATMGRQSSEIARQWTCRRSVQLFLTAVAACFQGQH